jgi:SAM-dependent methyltransferase
MKNMKNRISRVETEKIRQVSFRKKYDLDTQLINTVSESASNQFLTNPPIHTIYLYLVDFVTQLSAKWTEKDLSDIKMLDWGTGKGHISYLLQKKGVKVTSCDIFDSEATDSTFGQDTPILKEFGIEVDPLEHPYKLPYEDESFDVLLSFGVLEHVPNDEESIKEISRVLRKDGLFFCFHLPQPLSWTQKIQHLRKNFYHDRFYTKKTIDHLTKVSGLEVLDMWHRAFFPKNTINYPMHHTVEKLDLFFTENTFLKHLATNIEFVATKK